MKILRFIWDHPGLCALGCVVVWLSLPVIAAHPIPSGAVLAIGGLSLWAGFRNIDRTIAIMTVSNDRLAEVRRLHIEAARRDYAAWAKVAKEHSEPRA